MSKNNHASAPTSSRVVDAVDAYLRRDGKGGLTPIAREIGEDVVYSAKKASYILGGLAISGAVVYGFIPQQVGAATVEVKSGSFTSMVQEGVDATGVKGISKRTVISKAEELDFNQSDAAFQPGDTMDVRVMQSPADELLGHINIFSVKNYVSIDVANTSRGPDAHHG